MRKAQELIAGKIREWFSLDYRSLAILRIGVGITILADLIQRAMDLRTFYSDSGVLPRSELLRLGSSSWDISIHMMSGLASFEIILFIGAAIFAVMLIVGYRTRLAIIASWFLLISLHFRNPMVLQGGDVVFRVIVFWMMFLPLERTWSLDRLFNRITQVTTKTFLSAATAAYIIQICLIYLFSGLLKTGIPWHDGTAVYYALHVDQLITPFGAFVREFPGFMAILTYGVWYLEVYGIILFFSPWKTALFRTIGIIAFALLQVGFNSGMRLGLFGMIAIVVTLGLLPSDFWDNWMQKFSLWLRKKGKPGLIIYYDADCTFCAKVSNILYRILFLHPETHVLAAETNTGIQSIMDRENSWVIVDGNGKHHTGWDGYITIISYSPIAAWKKPLLTLKPIAILGQKIYEWVAQKRMQVCVPEPVEKISGHKSEIKKLGNIILTLLIIYVIAWNIDTMGSQEKFITPELEWFGIATHMDQEWNMFAPMPLKEDGWYVVPGTLRDGTSIDARTGNEITYEKPKWVAYTYKNQRWQKYMMNLWSRDNSEYRLGYGQYLCREWNNNHPYEQQLLDFEIIFMLEKTPRPGKTPSPVEPVTIWNHHCF